MTTKETSDLTIKEHTTVKFFKYKLSKNNVVELLTWVIMLTCVGIGNFRNDFLEQKVNG